MFNPSLLHTASTYSFVTSQDGKTPGPLLIDGAPAPGSATVTILFAAPDGTSFTRSAVYASATQSWSYAGTTSDFAVPGAWSRTWRVVNGGTDVTLEPAISFTVLGY